MMETRSRRARLRLMAPVAILGIAVLGGCTWHRHPGHGGPGGPGGSRPTLVPRPTLSIPRPTLPGGGSTTPRPTISIPRPTIPLPTTPRTTAPGVPGPTTTMAPMPGMEHGDHDH
jgi:hypothetical protein